MKRLLRQALDHGGVGGELGAIIKRSEIGGRGSGAPRTAFESAGEPSAAIRFPGSPVTVKARAAGVPNAALRSRKKNIFFVGLTAERY